MIGQVVNYLSIIDTQREICCQLVLSQRKLVINSCQNSEQTYSMACGQVETWSFISIDSSSRTE